MVRNNNNNNKHTETNFQFYITIQDFEIQNGGNPF